MKGNLVTLNFNVDLFYIFRFFQNEVFNEKLQILIKSNGLSLKTVS